MPHDPPDADRRTAFMLKVGKQVLRIGNPEARRITRTFVHFNAKTEDDFLKPIMEDMAVRAKEAGWACLERPFDI